MLSLRDGRLPAGGDHPLGLWFRDCRFLCEHELRIAGERPTLLTSTDAAGSEAVHELTTADRSIRIRLVRTVEARGALRERVTVQSYRREPVVVPLELRFGADFLPMLELRGLVPRHDRAVDAEAEGFATQGRDGVRRATEVHATPTSRSAGGGLLAYELELESRGSVDVVVDFDLSERPDDEPAVVTRADGEEDRMRVVSDDELFNRILERSLVDLDMLRSELNGHAYHAAGVPWFATLFGRDSIITALETLPFAPGVAEGTLRLLASRLGEQVDDDRDEEPGKVIHELRVGEPAALGETPFARYFGSVDSTPLFLSLLCRHADWSGTLDLFRELREPAEAALDWIDRHGDLDGDGLVEYRRRSPHGLVTQGWKDSPDGVPRADGDPLAAPVALVEVQGYVAGAKRAMARLFELDGDASRAERLRGEAVALEARLDGFWLPEERSYAIGLDADKRPGSGLASNQGHLLWSGAVSDERARAIRDVLMGPDLFTGWGVRTLGQSHPSYNPLGYHTGSVWPHDSAMIAAGLRRYGFDEDFSLIFEGLLEAASRFTEHRLPELFAGFPRAESLQPVPYPVACRPQAWAAGSVPYLLTLSLGLEPDALNKRLRVVRPSLPRWLERLTISGLRLGTARIDLSFERSGKQVALSDVHVEGDAEVVLGNGG